MITSGARGPLALVALDSVAAWKETMRKEEMYNPQGPIKDPDPKLTSSKLQANLHRLEGRVENLERRNEDLNASRVAQLEDRFNVVIDPWTMRSSERLSSTYPVAAAVDSSYGGRYTPSTPAKSRGSGASWSTPPSRRSYHSSSGSSHAELLSSPSLSAKSSSASSLVTWRRTSLQPAWPKSFR
eukprot:TRINITY_DN48394_c0_g1_i1.p1 TRINITY_DN48394_c0_g1~~TRINITY_DN48394_c0_g1_i1.p1  ORF type:complete len:184 (-),score=23.02 TRINITY_DN48394_c0_g1_i1:86-637(-)